MLQGTSLNDFRDFTMLRQINQTFTIQLSKISKTDKINSLLIIGIWLLMVVIVNPLGDFPLNDDWIFGLSVKYLLENGDFRLPAFSAPNSFFNIFFGAVFCLPFGFSFTALRFSTLVLGLIGVLTTYAILRQLKATPEISFLGALLVAFNPMYFGLSNTFMTDVPFFTFAILSLYFLILGLQKNSKIEIIIGIIISYIAFLIRQYGIIILLTFGFGYLIKKGLSFKTIVQGFSPVVIASLIQISYQKWLMTTDRLPLVDNPQYNNLLRVFNGIFESKAWLNILDYFRNSILGILIYLGSFLLPFIIIFFSQSFPSHRPRIRMLILGLLSLFSFTVINLLISMRVRIPFFGNILTPFGLGPLTLRDTYIVGLNYPLPSLNIRISWTVMTLMGVINAGLLIYFLIVSIIPIKNQSQDPDNLEKKGLKFFIISAIISYSLLIILSSIFDRYLLPLLPLFMLMILLSTKEIVHWKLVSVITPIILIFMLMYGGFTITATHDYLAWNRTRWQALNNLMKEDNISPNLIDGGYEFNGWYLYDADYKRQQDKSWWWVDGDDYVISSGPLQGYQPVRQYPFRRWFLGSEDNIFVLRKMAGSNSP